MGLIIVQWGIIIRADYSYLPKTFKTNKQKKKKPTNKSWQSANVWKTKWFLQFYVENSKQYEESTHFEMKFFTFYISLYWNDFLNYFSNTSKFKIGIISQFYPTKMFKMKYERRINFIDFFF